jgi:2-amino-4-hydroxy-6-hydroxymethyldihydropteridine diphosphokinase
MSRAAAARVFIGVGSNVDPVAYLQLAISALAERYSPLQLSSVYRNPPVGFEGDDFLNMVVGFDTVEALSQVAAFLDEIHARVGRVAGEQKFGPRKLDLDLLLFGWRVDPVARVPRADVLRYAFVLGPMAEIAPTLAHPVSGDSMAGAWSAYAGVNLLKNLGSLADLKATRVTGTAGKVV